MTTKVISGTHTNTVLLGGYPTTFSDFSLTGVINVATSVGVFGSGAGKGWTVANSGLVSGTNGIVFNTGGLASTVSNTGTIVGTSTSGIGALLQSGGSVQNQGLIQGTLQGIRVSGAAGSIGNSGTVLSTSGAAVALTAGGTVANLGTIASSASYGISLTAGLVVNGSSAVATALVSGYRFGIDASPSSATTGIVNYGTIVATATNGKAVLLQSGGSIDNRRLISGVTDAIRVSGGSGTVTNSGTIAGTAGGGIVLNAAGIVINTGTVLSAQSYGAYVKYGSVGNGSRSATSAAIIGSSFGVLTGATSAATGVANYGTIAATAGTGTGVVLLSGGTIGNSSLISGGASGVSITGGNAAIVNTGRIQGLGGNGVYLGSGTLTNGSTAIAAAVVAGNQFGVLTGTTGGATIINYGSITASGTTGQGVLLQSGGSIDNRRLISGVSDAVRATGGTATVNNSGTVAATGAGIALNGGGTVTNTGLVMSAQTYGAYVKFGAVDNGSLTAATAAIIGYTFGILTGASSAASGIVNYGTISASSTSGTAVVLLSGGSVTNAKLLVSSGSGISITGGSGTVGNTGTIRGLTGNGVYLDDGSSLTNGAGGLVAAYGYGIITNGNVVVTNHGTIAALGTAGVGVVLGPGIGTLVNSGTIIGNSGHAAYLGGGDRLVVYPQAVFVGKVLVGGGSGNTLELAAGAGTGILGQFGYDISGLGTDLSGFGSLLVDTGASWQVAESGGTAHTVTNQGTIVVPTLGLLVTATLTGAGTLDLGTRSSVEIVGAVDAGQVVRFLDTTGTLFLHAPQSFGGTIDGFQTGDVIELVGSAATSLVYSGTASAGTLTVMNGATVVATLSFSGGTGYSQSAFTLTQAGDAGAGVFKITLGQPQTTSSGGLFYNVLYDSSVANAPVGFFAGFNQAVQFMEVNFVDPISVNLDLGWGEVAGEAMDPSQLGEGKPQGGTFYTYDQVKAILANNADSPAAQTALANLPAQDPTNGGLFYIGGAESKALGLIAGDATAVDAAVGLQIDPTLTFFTAGAMHEITESMGRIALVGTTSGSSTLYSVFDLFRYTAPGVCDPNATSGAYFSIDGGNTLINSFSDGTGQLGHTDLADWGGDTSDVFNNPGPLGQFSPGDFTVMDVLGTDVACFRRGTRIRTDRGEVPVEQLAIGGLVVTVSGVRRPIKWIGRRAYDGRFVRGNRNILPIRIEAGAFAEHVPTRDLYVSPEHAMVLDGLFLPARLLVNGATIRQVERVDAIEYFHIELDGHDVILAEGAAAETFADFGSRGMFHNAAEYAVRYPDAAPVEWHAYAALLEEGEAGLPAVRARLRARAERLGRISSDPDLHLRADGSMLPPQAVSGCVYRFTIPAGARNVTIASRSAVPAETEARSADRRALGVAVERIVLSAGARQIEIGPDSVALREGFHANEGSHRWTDGDARLSPEVLAGFDGAISLELHLSETELCYPTEASAAAHTRAAPPGARENTMAA